MVKKPKITLATGWLNSEGIFEDVPRNEQQTWAARHLINDLNDLTHYGKEVEAKLQEIYNYMKFEEGFLMSAIWRKPGMYFTMEQVYWVEDNQDRLVGASRKFIDELVHPEDHEND